MGIVEQVKAALGMSSLSPEAEEIVDSHLRHFLRDKFVNPYFESRKEGISEAVARDHMLQMLLMHLQNHNLKNASIKMISAGAKLRCFMADRVRDEAALERAVERRIRRRFNRKALIATLVAEVHAVEVGAVDADVADEVTVDEATVERDPAAISTSAEPRSPAQGEVTIQGSKFPLAADAQALCDVVSSVDRAALRIPTLSYGDTLADLMRAMQRRYGDRAPQVAAITAASLVCAGCGIEFPGSFKLSLQDPDMFGGGMFVAGGVPGREEFARTGACPQCGATESYYAYECVDRDAITQADVQAIRDYWRHLAKSWWENETRSSAICDWCNAAVERDEGYLSGSSLVCTDCMAKDLLAGGLAKLQGDPEYFGAGLIRKARAFREHS